MRCHVVLAVREANSSSVARRQWSLSGLFVAFLYEMGSTTESVADRVGSSLEGRGMYVAAAWARERSLRGRGLVA